MTREDLIDFCLMFTASYEDYPFDDIADSGAWTVMRHRANKKSFALIYERNGKLCVNLKCNPFEADFLRVVKKEGTHLAESKDTPDAVRGTLLSNSNRQLAGQTEFVKIDESELEYSPDYVLNCS